jgi:hypothetical protein
LNSPSTRRYFDQLTTFLKSETKLFLLDHIDDTMALLLEYIDQCSTLLNEFVRQTSFLDAMSRAKELK